MYVYAPLLHVQCFMSWMAVKVGSVNWYNAFKYIMLPPSTVVEIGFDPTDYTVIEDDGTVILFVHKIGENEIPVTVNISTSSDTAEGMHRLCTCN